MAMTVDIGTAGEAAAVNELKSQGWKIHKWNTKSPGSTDIEASKGEKKILVQVKSAVPPDVPASLSADEERNIKSRAIKSGASAHVAKVTLDRSLKAIDVSWKKIP